MKNTFSGLVESVKCSFEVLSNKPVVELEILAKKGILNESD